MFMFVKECASKLRECGSFDVKTINNESRISKLVQGIFYTGMDN